MTLRNTSLLAAVLLLLPATAIADHPTQGLETLAGVPAVEVVIRPLDGRLAANGVTREAVRRRVEGVLREAGIATGEAEHGARLHVRVESRKATRRFLALSIGLDLSQHVRLDRAPEQRISAVTWSNAAVTPLKEGAYGEVPRQAAELVRRTFVRDFLAANPD